MFILFLLTNIQQNTMTRQNYQHVLTCT